MQTVGLEPQTSAMLEDFYLVTALAQPPAERVEDERPPEHLKEKLQRADDGARSQKEYGDDPGSHRGQGKWAKVRQWGVPESTALA